MESRKIQIKDRPYISFLELRTKNWLNRLIRRFFRNGGEGWGGREQALENMIEKAVLQYQSRAYHIKRHPGKSLSGGVAGNLLLDSGSGWRLRRVFNNQYVLESN